MSSPRSQSHLPFPPVAGGKGESIRFAMEGSTLGVVLVATSERGICAILMGSDREALIADLKRRFDQAEIVARDADDARVVAQVVALVEAPRTVLRLSLDIRGTAFQQRVWKALGEIPCGETVTYTELAERVGAPKSVRAVAAACGANKLAVVIPCHRVLRRDGGLAGYRWGIERKRALLDREAESLR